MNTRCDTIKGIMKNEIMETDAEMVLMREMIDNHTNRDYVADWEEIFDTVEDDLIPDHCDHLLSEAIQDTVNYANSRYGLDITIDWQQAEKIFLQAAGI